MGDIENIEGIESVDDDIDVLDGLESIETLDSIAGSDILENLKDNVNKSVKNFRSSTDIENFYRFIYDNNLRREASVILKNIYDSVTKPKKRNKLQ